MIALLRRSALRFQIRSLEIQVDGMTECLECVGDPLWRHRIELARSDCSRHLAHLRQRYNALLPVAKRRHWGLA